jgi:biopolymer transport protein ExbD
MWPRTADHLHDHGARHGFRHRYRRTEDQTVATTTKELPVVSITKAGELFLGKDPININNLVEAIHTRYPGQSAVYIKADKLTTMDVSVPVMSTLGNAKFGISVVTQLEDQGRRR